MVLYLAREYKSAGVVSRIATTRKKVEGIKRCSLLFDRERRRFLFAKRAFSRFDVLAFVVLLRLFSLSLFAIFFFHCALSSNPSRVVRSRRTQKKESSSKTKKKRESLLGGRKKLSFLFFFFFSLFVQQREEEHKKRDF